MIMSGKMKETESYIELMGNRVFLVRGCYNRRSSVRFNAGDSVRIMGRQPRVPVERQTFHLRTQPMNQTTTTDRLKK